MNKFQPIQYIRKYALVLILFFVLLTCAFRMLLGSMQSYTAVSVINYSYDGAENGRAPDGTPLDVTGIYSSNVVSQALRNLGLPQSQFPVDVIRSSVTVEQIEDESVTAVNEAVNSDGETSELQPTEYMLSYTGSGSYGADLTRSILDEILDVYFADFSRQYLNSTSVVNSTSQVNQGSFDYIEQVELISDGLESAVNSLSERASSGTPFYSVQTGYSFHELVNEFSSLQETRISSLFAYILRHRVTKDPAALLDKYEQRLQSFQFEQEQDRARVSEVEGIIDAYVEKLRESNNTAQSQVLDQDGNAQRNNNVLGDVETPNYTTENDSWVAYDQTTEYEQLLQNWISISDAYNRSIVEAGYCQYVIDCFSGNLPAVLQYQIDVSQITNLSGNDAVLGVSGETVNPETIQAQLSSDVYTEDTVPCTQADIDYVEQEIEDILGSLNRLYAITAATDAEYNEYLGARYIEVLASSQVTAGLNVPLYTALGAFLFLVVGCLGVIILGRAGDILEYIAFTDHTYRLPNRVACDRYIQKHSEKVLPSGMGYLFFQISNQKEINRRLGRSGGDEVMAYFAMQLKEFFRRGDGDFVGYNGSGQFMAFVQKTDAEDLQSSLSHLNLVLGDFYAGRDVTVEYSVGFAVADGRESHRIRTLIGAAMQQRKTYRAGASKEDSNGREKE